MSIMFKKIFMINVGAFALKIFMINERSITLKLTYIDHQGFTKYFLIMLFKLKSFLAR